MCPYSLGGNRTKDAEAKYEALYHTIALKNKDVLEIIPKKHVD